MNEDGYSGTPLIRKLGVKPGQVLAVIDPPAGFDDTLGPLPADVTAHPALSGAAVFDLVLFFTTGRAALADLITEVRPLMAPACGLWIAWPKRASGLPTELTDNVVREIALPTGLVDNKVCAIDATWSGLRLVIRRELRKN
jgi:hypothetical protein